MSAVQRSGIVNGPLRSPFAHAASGLPLPSLFKGAILGSTTGMWRMSVNRAAEGASNCD